MPRLASNVRSSASTVETPGSASRVNRLTPLQWLICGVAALGFAFDLYESVVLAVVIRPVLAAVGSLKPGTPEFNLWVGLLFYVPAMMGGGVFGLLGGYLTDLFGRRRVLPAIPLMIVRPLLPESAIWKEKKSKGVLKRPSIAALFGPAFRKTTLVTTLLAACFYALPYGVLQQTPHVIPGLPEMRGLPARHVEQTVGTVQFIAELGTIAGRLLFPLLVVRIASQRRLLRLFLVPGLVIFAGNYFLAATHSLLLLMCGIFLAALLMNGTFSFMWNYLPWVYPTHLRGTGEGFASNFGGRVLGASAALLTTQLANIMPGAGSPARMAYSAGTVAVLAYAVSLVGSCWLREPERTTLPD